MDKTIIAQQDANLRVKNVFERYPEEVAKNVSLETHVAEFQALVTEIIDLDVSIENIPNIIASSKNMARSEIIDLNLRRSKQMYVFAGETKNYKLTDFLKVNVSAYNHLRTADVAAYAQALLQNVILYAPDLVEVGIGDEQIAELTAATDAFLKLQEDPRAQINQRKKMISNMKLKIEETKTMLAKVFDFLISSYPADSAFVQDYQVARIVVDPATHHRKDDPVEE